MSKGTVKIKNLDGYFDWVRALKEEDTEALKERLKDAIFKHYPEKNKSQEESWQSSNSLMNFVRHMVDTATIRALKTDAIAGKNT